MSDKTDFDVVICPVIYVDLSESRKQTNGEISSTVPSLRKEMRDFT